MFFLTLNLFLPLILMKFWIIITRTFGQYTILFKIYNIIYINYIVIRRRIGKGGEGKEEEGVGERGGGGKKG